MPIVVLTHWTQKFNTPGDQAFLGITMLLVGISLVLLILVLISILVSIMSKMISRKRKNKFEKTDSKINPVEKPKAQEQVSLLSADKFTDDGQDPAIIAVIAAAVHAMLTKETGTRSKAGFKIRRIRRV